MRGDGIQPAGCTQAARHELRTRRAMAFPDTATPPAAPGDVSAAAIAERHATAPEVILPTEGPAGALGRHKALASKSATEGNGRDRR